MNDLEQALLGLLEVTPVYIRVTDSHGSDESEIERDEIERLREDGELLPILIESKQAWLKFSDGKSITISPHTQELAG